MEINVYDGVFTSGTFMEYIDRCDVHNIQYIHFFSFISFDLVLVPWDDSSLYIF